MIKLIIGLGNPEKKYEQTYHNVGFLLVDFLKAEASHYTLLKSDTYMNESGSFVAREAKKRGVGPAELMVAHDESDLPLGTWKIESGRGAAGHKGVESIIQALGTAEFRRIRIGIRRPLREGEPRKKAGEFVLSPIGKKERETLLGIFGEIAEELKQD